MTLRETDRNSTVLCARKRYAQHFPGKRTFAPAGRLPNGYTIDRNLSVSTSDGHVIKVEGALTLEDSAGGGVVRGGNNYASGAEGGGVFTLSGGQIAGNQGYYGGGVASADMGDVNAFTLSGGGIHDNEARMSAGASCSTAASSWCRARSTSATTRRTARQATCTCRRTR